MRVWSVALLHPSHPMTAHQANTFLASRRTNDFNLCGVLPGDWVHGRKAPAGTHSSNVVTSPSGNPCARALSTRRMIFPERVLGNDSTNSRCSGLAMGPISRSPGRAAADAILRGFKRSCRARYGSKPQGEDARHHVHGPHKRAAQRDHERAVSNHSNALASGNGPGKCCPCHDRDTSMK